MRRTHYTAEIRVLLCDACGAPIETTVQGGQVVCAYCRAQNFIWLRPMESALAPPRITVSDEERWRLLRSQDGRPMNPPPALAHLVQGVGLHPAKVDEAFHVYRQTKREVTTTHSPEAAERLYFLTILLNVHLGSLHDDSRRRAILETSLETLSLPRHQQVLRCLLASAAVKENDLASAERWIAPCDPMSHDLEADSAWRCARVFIDTARGDWNAVLRVLGTVDDQIPIADAWDLKAAVFRANALERLGDLRGAVTALQTRLGKERHARRTRMQKFIEEHPQFALCQQSFPKVAAVAAARGADGDAVGLLFLGAAGGAVLIIGALIVGSGGSGFGMSPIFWVAIGASCAFLAIQSYLLRKRAQRAAWLRANGILAQGVVRWCEEVGSTKINGAPFVRVSVEIDHPSMPRYLASCKRLLTPDIAPSLAIGNVVSLRIHPEKPQEIIIESM